MRPHEELDVWKKAIEFVVAVYRATDEFPKDERFGLIPVAESIHFNSGEHC
jgi:four helix bundle protein